MGMRLGVLIDVPHGIAVIDDRGCGLLEDQEDDLLADVEAEGFVTTPPNRSVANKFKISVSDLNEYIEVKTRALAKNRTTCGDNLDTEDVVLALEYLRDRADTRDGFVHFAII